MFGENGEILGYKSAVNVDDLYYNAKGEYVNGKDDWTNYVDLASDHVVILDSVYESQTYETVATFVQSVLDEVEDL